MITNIPAHPFEAMKRANPDGAGLIDDPMCGYHHRIDDETGVFCQQTANDRVHRGEGKPVRVREWTDGEIGAVAR